MEGSLCGLRLIPAQVVVLDPDCVLVAPVDYPVKEGSPIAQQGYYMFQVSPGRLSSGVLFCR